MLDRITVMFGDTGATYPHLVEYVETTCEALGATLLLVKPLEDVLSYTKRVGLPSDLVPVWATEELEPFMRDKPRQKIQSAMKCCMNMLLLPMYKAVVESGAKVLIRGTKKSDSRIGLANGTIDENGIKHVCPVWEWSDGDVYDYLRKEGAELAPHYSEVKSSLDCWCCTGHAPFDDFANKLAYTEKHYPDLWPELERRLTAVKEATRSPLEM